ncbi:hypothetical protein KII94_05930, partial [Leuconostoc gelidum subsp. gasicomitatum]|uniref:hypothetical protein n=1 Tax=Leuconostoc gasicomitatum TaxID=115778 RepID=UPI001CC7FDD1
TGLLKKYNLELSSEKFEIKNLSQSSKFTFLGYQFSLNDRNLIISIADEKITKIQRRINTYFSEFLKYKSYTRLYFKLKNLFFGITTISTTATSKQRQGIPYSYEFITSFESIQLLINNIEYQLKKIKTLKSQQYQEIRKLYYPYLQKNITSLRTITKTLRFNYFNLSVKNLCDIIQSLDISFKYTKQSKQGLIHILFYLLYKNEH